MEDRASLRVVVGGVDYAVGGWASYEAGRRGSRWEAAGDPPGQHYPARTHIGAEDAAFSILTSRPGRGLRRAATMLADALDALEARHRAAPAGRAPGRPVTVPAASAADLRGFAGDPERQAAPEDLRAAGEGAVSAAAAVGIELPPVPPLRAALPRAAAVRVDDPEGVLRLEATVVPYAEAVEELQAAVATRLVAAAKALEGSAAGATGGAAGARGAKKKASARPRGDGPPESPPRDPPRPAETGPTRGEEVDAASADARGPLGVAIPPGHIGPYDIEDGKFVPAADGIYYGMGDRDEKSRKTMLDPATLQVVAWWTSGRKFAWYVLDSPEGAFALRAPPKEGRLASFDPDELSAWLRPRLVGHPPHKIDLDMWLGHLRSLGFEIQEGLRRFPAARFDLHQVMPRAELDKELQRIRALSGEELDALDWGEYDRLAAAGACTSTVETGGEVTFDLAAGKVVVQKVRPGLLFTASVFFRSSVVFHTHPSDRARGTFAEPPSEGDLAHALYASAWKRLAWSLVSAPEGTYIIRPSGALVAAYMHNPIEVVAAIKAAYRNGLGCHGTPAACMATIVQAIREAGFVAHFRNSPCMPLPGAPDIGPQANAMSRGASRAERRALADMSGADLLRLDWAPADGAANSFSLSMSTWATARLDGGRVVISDGHEAGLPGDPSTYPEYAEGPLFLVIYPNEADFPTRIPPAAIAAAENRPQWAWVIYLSPTRVLAFRADKKGVEVHGPAVRPATGAVRPGEMNQ